MRFVSSRELRIRPGAVWNLLRREKDLVITTNGKPVGVLTAADEERLEDILATLRQGRAQAAVADLRRDAVRRGLTRVSHTQVEAIIGKARAGSRPRVPGARPRRTASG
jgi:PHD/YefM family antitoxin component YafN of YafNO toxin-antitoxin module